MKNRTITSGFLLGLLPGLCTALVCLSVPAGIQSEPASSGQGYPLDHVVVTPHPLSPVNPCARNLPPEVEVFVKRRRECDRLLRNHGDQMPQRPQSAFHESWKSFCLGSESELLEMTRKYSSDPPSRECLAQFDSKFENTGRATFDWLR